MRSNLVEVFPPEERLVFEFAEEDGERLGLGALLPLRAGAVPRQGVVPHPVVVGVLTGQNAASAGAAQRRDRKLQEGAQNGNRGRQQRNRGTEEQEGINEQNRRIQHALHSQEFLSALTCIFCIKQQRQKAELHILLKRISASGL